MFEDSDDAADIASETATSAAAVEQAQTRALRLSKRVDELERECDRLRDSLKEAEARKPSPGLSLRGLVATLSISAATAAGSWFFSDSLIERANADVRRDVLTVYFGTENGVFGKRRQILTFVENLPNKGLGLENWIASERRQIDEEERKAGDRIEAAKNELTVIEQRNALIGTEAKALIDGLTSSPTREHDDVVEDRIRQFFSKSADSADMKARPIPGSVGRVLGDWQNASVLKLFEITGTSELPDPSHCNSLEITLLANQPNPLVKQHEFDACRRSIIEWAALLSGNARSNSKEEEIPLDDVIQRATTNTMAHGGHDPQSGLDGLPPGAVMGKAERPKSSPAPM